jgi:hypothetical protein
MVRENEMVDVRIGQGVAEVGRCEASADHAAAVSRSACLRV